MASRSQRRPRTVTKPIAKHYEPSPTASYASSSSESFERLAPAPRHDSRDHRRPRVVAYTAPEPSTSESSISTLDSEPAEEVDAAVEIIPDEDDDEDDDEGEQLDGYVDSPDSDDEDEDEYIVNSRDAIPPALPAYTPHLTDSSPIRPSTPRAFGKLFPSLNRLSVRHDDLTPDGNMNLRVDTVVPASPGSRTRRAAPPVSVQLFHLRMKDLARRDFSLRRYCRDSGREVCSSKRSFAQQSSSRGVTRPGIQHSVSSAIRSVKTPFQRSTSSIFKRPSTGRSYSSSTSSSSWDNTSLRSQGSSSKGNATSAPAPTPPRLEPTDTIRLEFSNYARVDVTRNEARSGTRYEFEWWGHQYAWRRIVDENLGVASFHLFRDGKGAAVAHIVPEGRSPNQVDMEEYAGGWVPPCYMWISDESIVNAVTDVADIIIATGLITLVDDSIVMRWRVQKPPRRPIKASTTGGFAVADRSRTLIPSLFSRRQSTPYTASPMKYGRPVAAY